MSVVDTEAIDGRCFDMENGTKLNPVWLVWLAVGLAFGGGCDDDTGQWPWENETVRTMYDEYTAALEEHSSGLASGIDGTYVLLFDAYQDVSEVHEESSHKERHLFGWRTVRVSETKNNSVVIDSCFMGLSYEYELESSGEFTVAAASSSKESCDEPRHQRVPTWIDVEWDELTTPEIVGKYDETKNIIDFGIIDYSGATDFDCYYAALWVSAEIEMSLRAYKVSDRFDTTFGRFVFKEEDHEIPCYEGRKVAIRGNYRDQVGDVEIEPRVEDELRLG
jgi:hypothetical protein